MSDKVKRSEFVKIMLENDMDEDLKEIDNAQEYRNCSPRSAAIMPGVDDVNCRNKLDADLEEGARRPSLKRIFIVAAIAVVIIVALIAVNM